MSGNRERHTARVPAHAHARPRRLSRRVGSVASRRSSLIWNRTEHLCGPASASPHATEAVQARTGCHKTKTKPHHHSARDHFASSSPPPSSAPASPSPRRRRLGGSTSRVPRRRPASGKPLCSLSLRLARRGCSAGALVCSGWLRCAADRFWRLGAVLVSAWGGGGLAGGSRGGVGEDVL